MGIISISKPNLATLEQDKTALGLAGLGLLGLVLRLWQINGAVWYDEAFTAWLAELPLSRLISATMGDVHPPGYYLLLWLLRATTASLGVNFGPILLRLPSFLAGFALIFVVYRLALKLEMAPGPRWIATALVALAPFQIYYSNEARFYALQTLFVALAALGLVERRWWLVIGASLAALYIHNMSVIFIAGLFAAFFVWPQLWTKSFFAAGLVIAVGWIPGLIITLYQTLTIKGNFWVPPVTNPLGRLIMILDNLIFLTPHSPFGNATAAVTALGLVIIALALPYVLKSPGYTPMILLAWVIPPVAMGMGMSLLWQPVMIPRTMAPLAPFYYLLLAWSVTRTPRRLLAWAAIATPLFAAVLVCLLYGLIGRLPVDTDYLSIYGGYQPGDGVYHASMGSYLPWHYYRSDIPQYVIQQKGGLVNDLSTQTKTAMGIPALPLEYVICRQPRWWIIQFKNPTSSPVELQYIDAITARYNAQKTAVLRQDATVDAWIYLINTAPFCLPR